MDRAIDYLDILEIKSGDKGEKATTKTLKPS
jgi:hypothetical protein